MNLFETYTGADFLAFYAVMLLTCVGLSLWIPASMRPSGSKTKLEDPEDIAFLSGGFKRHALSVLADLYAKGALGQSTKGKISVTRTGVDTTIAGAAVLNKVGSFSLSEAMKTVRRYARDTERGLIARGLMMNSRQFHRLRARSAFPFVALFFLGFYRMRAGDKLDEPTGYLTVLLVVTVVISLVRLWTVSRHTRAGQTALKDWMDRSSRLRRAPDSSEVKLAVGLFGTGVLVGTPYAHVHAMRHSTAGGDGGGFFGGDSGDGGGGGGCGGGCGGCGG